MSEGMSHTPEEALNRETPEGAETDENLAKEAEDLRNEVAMVDFDTKLLQTLTAAANTLDPNTIKETFESADTKK